MELLGLGAVHSCRNIQGPETSEKFTCESTTVQGWLSIQDDVISRATDTSALPQAGPTLDKIFGTIERRSEFKVLKGG